MASITLRDLDEQTKERLRVRAARQGRSKDLLGSKLEPAERDFALETLGIADASIHRQLMALYETLDAFEEVPAVSRRLREAGIKTAILSSGTPAMLESATASAGIRDLLDRVLSVDALHVYKPDPRVYQLAVDELRIAADRIAFQSANAWDAHGAATFGMRVVWCNRYGQRAERLPGQPTAK